MTFLKLVTPCPTVSSSGSYISTCDVIDNILFNEKKTTIFPGLRFSGVWLLRVCARGKLKLSVAAHPLILDEEIVVNFLLNRNKISLQPLENLIIARVRYPFDQQCKINSLALGKMRETSAS